LCGLVAVIGHVFPVYVGFRGGKGVATAAGMLLATAPLPTACAAGLFLVAVLLSGYVSLGSILAAVCVPVLIALFGQFGLGDYPPLLLGLTGALLLFILLTHRKNIVRLARGSEPHFAGLPVWKRPSSKP
jgi:glycerol-3-phosphate acyltransferase PlsY